MIQVVGWDIGGANTKAVALRYEAGRVWDVRVVSHPFEIWRDREALSDVLLQIAGQLGAEPRTALAVTTTAELSDAFRTKREGVLFVLDHVARAFGEERVYALDIAGELATLDEARRRPLDFAAANWVAGALFIARHFPNCFWVDVGSTTTDIIPIENGRIAARGRTDLERLAAGELVYAGVLRTNPAAVVSHVPIRGALCRVSAEYFAITGDVYLILGLLTADDYTCPTPDARDKTVEDARERLARLVCADAEGLDVPEIRALAGYIHEQLAQQVTNALLQVASRFPSGLHRPVVATGIGRFLAVESCRRLGLRVVDAPAAADPSVANVAPSLAVAYLLAARLEPEWHG